MGALGGAGGGGRKGLCVTRIPCSCSDDCQSDDCEYLFACLDSRGGKIAVGNGDSRRFQRKKPDIVNPNSEKDIRSTVLQSLQSDSDDNYEFLYVIDHTIGCWGWVLAWLAMSSKHHFWGT